MNKKSWKCLKQKNIIYNGKEKGIQNYLCYVAQTTLPIDLHNLFNVIPLIYNKNIYININLI